jgi:hypothetical protein
MAVDHRTAAALHTAEVHTAAVAAADMGGKATLSFILSS